jgi:hypothetical protein
MLPLKGGPSSSSFWLPETSPIIWIGKLRTHDTELVKSTEMTGRTHANTVVVAGGKKGKDDRKQKFIDLVASECYRI